MGIFGRHKEKKREFNKIYLSDGNKSLFIYISVIYGAVLSFGFYVFCQIVLKTFAAFKSDAIDLRILSQGIIQIGFFIITTLYLIIDIGGMVKVTHNFEYKLHSRFIHDVLIALMFLLMYDFIDGNIIAYFFAFSMNMLFAAIWGNNLKEEATLYMEKLGSTRALGTQERAEHFRYINWGIIIRQTHYLGSFFFLMLLGISYRLNAFCNPEKPPSDNSLLTLIILILGFFAWYTYFLMYSIRYSEERDRELSIPIGMPIEVFLKIVDNNKRG